jgi:hypothetical protein
MRNSQRVLDTRFTPCLNNCGQYFVCPNCNPTDQDLLDEIQRLKEDKLALRRKAGFHKAGTVISIALSIPISMTIRPVIESISVYVWGHKSPEVVTAKDRPNFEGQIDPGRYSILQPITNNLGPQEMNVTAYLDCNQCNGNALTMAVISDLYPDQGLQKAIAPISNLNGRVLTFGGKYHLDTGKYSIVLINNSNQSLVVKAKLVVHFPFR